MANIRFGTKFFIDPNEVELLPEKKRKWWLKEETAGFINIPSIPCDQAVDITVELADGDYTLGCGDWNTVGTNGQHLQQRCYFKVENGVRRYCKKTDFGVATPMNDITAYGGVTAPYTPATPVTSTPTPAKTELPDFRYCTKLKKMVSPEYSCVVDYTPRDGIGSECCMNCATGVKVYIE